jgi:hypothetical protein
VKATLQQVAYPGDVAIRIKDTGRPTSLRFLWRSQRRRRIAGGAGALVIDEMQYLSEEELGALIMAMHQISHRQLPVVLAPGYRSWSHRPDARSRTRNARFNFRKPGRCKHPMPSRRCKSLWRIRVSDPVMRRIESSPTAPGVERGKRRKSAVTVLIGP